MIAFASPKRVLLTGATGYIGRQLLPHLEQRGERVRCLARNPHAVGEISNTTEIVQGDVFDFQSLAAALDGIHTAYYLVHSMASDGNFEDSDRRAARNFATAAKQAGVRRIIYLGGLGDDRDNLSPHLSSRHEVGVILRESRCEVIEFRASIVIGNGSLSFELVRALVDRLPVMVCPKWVNTAAQPIAISDVLDYLVAALTSQRRGSHIIEIGGPDRVTYGEIMREYARQQGLRRVLLSVPVLTPRLSSLWLSLVTPVYARVGRSLVESMRNPTVVNNHAAKTLFAIRPRGLSAAIEAALAEVRSAESVCPMQTKEEPDEAISFRRPTSVARGLTRHATAGSRWRGFAKRRRLTTNCS